MPIRSRTSFNVGLASKNDSSLGGVWQITEMANNSEIEKSILDLSTVADVMDHQRALSITTGEV